MQLLQLRLSISHRAYPYEFTRVKLFWQRTILDVTAVIGRHTGAIDSEATREASRKPFKL